MLVVPIWGNKQCKTNKSMEGSSGPCHSQEQQTEKDIDVQQL